MTGQAAMSVPLYWSKAGLPIGMHFSVKVGDAVAGAEQPI